MATALRLGGTVESTGETGWVKEATIRDAQGARLVVSQFAPRG